MQIQHRSTAVTLGLAIRHAASAMLVTLALCTPALSQSAAQPLPLDRPVSAATAGSLASAITREANQLALAGAATHLNAAQLSHTRTPRKRLGKWAVIPGLFAGAFLGAAVDCLMISGCGPGSPQIPTGVSYGMLVGVLTTAFAPREVAGTFLGVGGGVFAGSLVGAAIQGDCRGDDPCVAGSAVGASVGSIAGGVVGYRMSSQ